MEVFKIITYTFVVEIKGKKFFRGRSNHNVEKKKKMKRSFFSGRGEGGREREKERKAEREIRREREKERKKEREREKERKKEAISRREKKSIETSLLS